MELYLLWLFGGVWHFCQYLYVANCRGVVLMTTNIYEVFKDEIWQPEDLTKVLWYEDVDCNIVYNEDGCIENLFNGDGNTYSYGSYHITTKGDLHLVVLTDDCGHDSFQAIFSLKNRQDEDKYWDSLEEGEEL